MVSAQRWASVRASINCALTTVRLPMRCTLPSSSTSTPSSSAIDFRPPSQSLYFITEVRERTSRPLSFESWVIRVSCRPPARPVESASSPRLVKGRTAIECGDPVAFGGASAPRRNQPTATTASSAATAYRRLLPIAGASTRTPSGVNCSNQAITSAKGNPSSSTKMKTRNAHGGASKAGKAMLAACTTSQATTT